MNYSICLVCRSASNCHSSPLCPNTERFSILSHRHCGLEMKHWGHSYHPAPAPTSHVAFPSLLTRMVSPGGEGVLHSLRSQERLTWLKLNGTDTFLDGSLVLSWTLNQATQSSSWINRTQTDEIIKPFWVIVKYLFRCSFPCLFFDPSLCSNIPHISHNECNISK